MKRKNQLITVSKTDPSLIGNKISGQRGDKTKQTINLFVVERLEMLNTVERTHTITNDNEKCTYDFRTLRFPIEQQQSHG